MTNFIMTPLEWNIRKMKLKEKFATLTETDVLLVKNMHEQMVERLQVRLGKTKDEILAIIARL